MDIQECSVCKVEFDLDKSGLVGPNSVVVCGSECGKKSCESRGNRYAIHDKTGDVVDTNAQPGDRHIY